VGHTAAGRGKSGEGVVGLQTPGGDGVAGEGREPAIDERGDGGAPLVAVDPGVGQAAEAPEALSVHLQ
jgi:hypothetical protein